MPTASSTAGWSPGTTASRTPACSRTCAGSRGRLPSSTGCRRSTRSSPTLLDHLDRALVALVADEEAGTEQLQEVLDLVTDALLSHLSYEERELLHPLAQSGFSVTLTPADHLVAHGGRTEVG